MNGMLSGRVKSPRSPKQRRHRNDVLAAARRVCRPCDFIHFAMNEHVIEFVLNRYKRHSGRCKTIKKIIRHFIHFAMTEHVIEFVTNRYKRHSGRCKTTKKIIRHQSQTLTPAER